MKKGFTLMEMIGYWHWMMRQKKSALKAPKFKIKLMKNVLKAATLFAFIICTVCCAALRTAYLERCSDKNA